MTVGITGHQDLDDPKWVEREIMGVLSAQPAPLVGVTSLAIGADQIFAHAVLECAGSLHVIVPFPGYEDTFDGEGLREYRTLLELSTSTDVLESEATSREEAYLAAGKRVVDLSDTVIAVWDGRPAEGTGGTGDIASYAQSRSKRLIHINPVTRTTVR